MRYLQIAIFTLLSLAVYSQDGFRDGFVVKKDGTIVEGQVKYRLNEASYESCQFRDKNGKVAQYLPGNIASYGYKDGKFYTSTIIDGEFVDVLVEGAVSLYKLRDQYYIRKDGELTTITSTMEVVTVSGKYLKRDVTNWRGTMSYLISDCMKLPEKTSFEEEDLTSVISNYNNCLGQDFVVYRESIPFASISYGIEFGISVSKLSPSGGSLANFKYLESNHASRYPFIGALIEIKFPRKNTNSGALINPQLSKQRYIGFTQNQESSRTEYFDSSIETTTFSLPFAYKYTYPAKVGSFFFTAGGNFDFNLKSKSNVVYELVIDDTVYSDEYEGLLINKFQYGVWGGIGFSKGIKSRYIGVMLKHFYMMNVSGSPNLDLNNSKSSFSLFFIL